MRDRRRQGGMQGGREGGSGGKEGGKRGEGGKEGGRKEGRGGESKRGRGGSGRMQGGREGGSCLAASLWSPDCVVLLEAVVMKSVVAGHSEKSSPTGAQGIENLQTCFTPCLKT